MIKGCAFVLIFFVVYYVRRMYVSFCYVRNVKLILNRSGHYKKTNFSNKKIHQEFPRKARQSSNGMSYGECCRKFPKNSWRRPNIWLPSRIHQKFLVDSRQRQKNLTSIRNLSRTKTKKKLTSIRNSWWVPNG